MEKLNVMYSNQKSFNGKALVDKNQNTTTLFSYGKPVCKIENGLLVEVDYYSATTQRHINEFLLQHNLKSMTKKDVEEFNAGILGAKNSSVKVVERKQINENYDPNKSNNGGRYYQERIVFELGGVHGVYEDTSCGDFGTRFYLKFNGKSTNWGTMERDLNYSEFTVDDPEFEALEDYFGIYDRTHFKD